MDTALNLLRIAQIIFYLAPLSHNQKQTKRFHIFFPGTASCKQNVPVRPLCLAQSRASAERQVDKAHACRASVSYWSFVCVSTANVNPFFPEDLATNPPATAARQSNEWPPILRETSIIICARSRRECQETCIYPANQCEMAADGTSYRLDSSWCCVSSFVWPQPWDWWTLYVAAKLQHQSLPRGDLKIVVTAMFPVSAKDLPLNHGCKPYLFAQREHVVLQLMCFLVRRY